jgi:hypothetical protein
MDVMARQADQLLRVRYAGWPRPQIQKRLVDVLAGKKPNQSRSHMSATSVNLLCVAAEIVGGARALANRLGVSETLLAKFMADSLELPDPLLLRAVDIILADRQRPPAAFTAAVQSMAACPGND